MRVASIDVGTNTVRLLVADDGYAIERDSRITRLGQGVDATGELGGEPMRRTLEVIREFVERARALGAEKTRIAGTSALRDANNRTEFVENVTKICDRPLEILDGANEGRTAYVGATSWLGEGRYVVCDIGGGSTELISADDVMSADVGSVRVRERFLKGDPPEPGSVERGRAAVKDMLQASGAARFGDGGLVGVAGTITTIAALDAGLKEYDSDVVHGYRLSAGGASNWAYRLNRLTADEIRALGPVAPGRADVIGAGALVLSVVMDVLGRDELTVSERDILDGLILRAFG